MILGEEVVEVTPLAEVTELNAAAFSGIIVKAGIGVARTIRDSDIEEFGGKSTGGIVHFARDGSITGTNVH